MNIDQSRAINRADLAAAEETPLLIFDGDCALCSAGIQWMLERDPRGRYRFATVQTPAAREIYARFGLDPDLFDTIMVLIDGVPHLRWSGVLAAARLMPPPWRWLGVVGRVVPDFIGDQIYDLVQRNRFKWFGRRAQCFTPADAMRGRFI